MFGFISFSIKLLFSCVLGAVLHYVLSRKINYENMISTSLISLFSASLLGLSKQLAIGSSSLLFSMGFTIFSVLFVVIAISKDLTFKDRIVWIFSSVIGIIIGSGYIIQASLLTCVVYVIINNNDYIISFVNDKNKNNTGVENISN